MEQIKIQEATRQREAAQRAPNAETVRHLVTNISNYDPFREQLDKYNRHRIWLVALLKDLLFRVILSSFHHKLNQSRSLLKVCSGGTAEAETIFRQRTSGKLNRT